jgi:hypothetical protein
MGARCTALMERLQVLRGRSVSRIDVFSDGMMTVLERKRKEAFRMRDLDMFCGVNEL